ncbi:hypothetical protein [Oryzibacter oryziterrae]|uniref:hypothetical protein n=1 Tax=Oryzibacter oryziterrae TaxID=2766474 RepID=UPI001F48EAD3|nr:hypothetical protein [Oryzibacter oryziterrae]
MRFLEFFKDNDGTYSAMRLALLLWVAGVLLAWIYMSIQSKVLCDIPQNVMTIIGMLTTGKVVQKFGETKLPVGDVPQPPAPH